MKMKKKTVKPLVKTLHSVLSNLSKEDFEIIYDGFTRIFEEAQLNVLIQTKTLLLSENAPYHLDKFGKWVEEEINILKNKESKSEDFVKFFVDAFLSVKKREHKEIQIEAKKERERNQKTLFQEFGVK